MKKKANSFLQTRIKGVYFALKGIKYVIYTEDSIKVQVFFALIAVILGFYFNISTTEWIAQLTVIGLVLVAEALNTAVEKIADFIHSDYHKKIGIIKDIAAGSAGFAAIISLIVAAIIYVPKITDLIIK